MRRGCLFIAFAVVGCGAMEPQDAGVDSGSDVSSEAPYICQGSVPPTPDVPMCNRCVEVGDAAPFCADGVYDPYCVGGTWQCVGDLIPLHQCVAGGPCQFVDAGSD